MDAGVFVVQTPSRGFEDFGFVDEMVVVVQCSFINGVNLCFWGLSLGLDCFFYKGHGRNGEVHSCGLLLSFQDLDSTTFSKLSVVPSKLYAGIWLGSG